MTFDPTLEPGTARGGPEIKIGNSSSAHSDPAHIEIGTGIVVIPSEELREALKNALNPVTNPYILGRCGFCEGWVGLQNMYEHGIFCYKRSNPINWIKYWWRKII